jgi:O-acetyl-ADP-ribose deacetylase (regulator of RNase III)
MGVYAYPPEEAIPILVQTAREVAAELKHVQEIRFVVMSADLQLKFEQEIARTA